MPRDSFTLYDLRVTVEASESPMVCNHREGDSFELRGENPGTVPVDELGIPTYDELVLVGMHRGLTDDGAVYRQSILIGLEVEVVADVHRRHEKAEFL